MVLKVEVIFVGKSDAIFHVGQAIDGIVEINVNKSKQFHSKRHSIHSTIK